MPTLSIVLLWLLGSSEERKMEREASSSISISMRPLTWALSLEQDVTISCRSNCRLFYLKKLGLGGRRGQIIFQRNADEYTILYVNRENRGEYICCCDFQGEYSGKCSESVELLIIDPDLPRPNITLIPSRMAVKGSNIAIHCWPREENENVYLLKDRGGLKPQLMESNGSTAIFHLRNVRPSDGGSYSCSYRPQSEFLVSSPSNPVELWILDPKLPKPNITLRPERVSLGGKVIIDCKSQPKVEYFYLQRPGHQKPLKSSVAEGTWARFTIQQASKKDSGIYSCMYKLLLSRHPVFSLPSDPATLLLPAGAHSNNAIATGTGIAVPILFLGLGAAFWYKKRNVGKRQSTAQIGVERSFRMAKVLWKAKPERSSANESGPKEKLPPMRDSPTETQDVVYAELKQKVHHIQSDDDSVDDSDSCVYTTVVPL